MVRVEHELIERLIKRLEERYSRTNLRKTLIILRMRSHLAKLEFLNSCFILPNVRMVDQLRPKEKQDPMSWYPSEDRHLCSELYLALLIERGKRGDKDALEKVRILTKEYKEVLRVEGDGVNKSVEPFVVYRSNERKKSFNERLVEEKYFFVISLLRSLLSIIKEITIQRYKNKRRGFLDIFVKVDKTRLLSVFKILTNSFFFSYDQLINLSCVDNLNLKSYNFNSRFSLFYVLNNISRASRLIIVTDFSEKDIIPSISSIHKSANWLEREVFDFFGIFFSDHFDLRRILTDYGFKGFPLRKDFPLTGYVELRYSEEKKYVRYKRLVLMQEYRFFNFLSPWEQYTKQNFLKV